MVLTRSGQRAQSVRISSVGGVRVMRGMLANVTSEDVVRLKDLALEGTPILNPDELRVQKVIQSDPVLTDLVVALCNQGLLEGRSLGPAVALHSHTGCEQQSFHTDYEWKNVVEAKPLGVLAALEDGTRFVTPEQVYTLNGSARGSPSRS